MHAHYSYTYICIDSRTAYLLPADMRSTVYDIDIFDAAGTPDARERGSPAVRERFSIYSRQIHDWAALAADLRSACTLIGTNSVICEYVLSVTLDSPLVPCIKSSCPDGLSARERFNSICLPPPPPRPSASLFPPPQLYTVKLQYRDPLIHIGDFSPPPLARSNP